MLLKDDNLGLGAKRGSERAENFGLAGFASILGRLNGKEEEVKKEEERQEKIQQRAYVYNKYGMMNFVSGGFLVGDKIEKGIKRADVEAKVEVKSEPQSSDSETQEKKSKKRKRSGDDEEVKQEDQSDEPTLKRKKKSMNLRDEAAKEDALSEKKSKSKKEKKDKKDKKSKSAAESPAIESPASASEATSDKALRKAEKRARKEEKKLKKALKKAAKEAAKSNAAVEDTSSESEEESTPSTSAPTTGTSTPSGLVYTPRGMHAVRQRYIRQKKMAGMDPQALKEVRFERNECVDVKLTRPDFYDQDAVVGYERDPGDLVCIAWRCQGALLFRARCSYRLGYTNQWNLSFLQ